MSEKIEQVTAAIRARIGTRHQGLPKGGWDGLMKLAAIDAIEAMREPTERMMVAAELAFPLLLTFADKEESGSYIAYRAMIDEALK